MELKIQVKSEPKNINQIEKLCCKACQKAGFTEDQTDDFSIALTESANNAILHGNKSDGNKNVTVEFLIEHKKIIAKISDEGKGFDVKNIPNPLAPENIYSENGRGILIIRSLVDSVSYEFNGKGTTMVLTKKVE
ncbi:ATP-binding protein [bacterium]|nr:ATP-binding protein [bacterium]